jgi:hypothetical protein
LNHDAQQPEPSLAEPSLGHFLYSDLRSKWVHEDHLVNHRVTWLLTSQAFFITAFGVLAKLRLDWMTANPNADRLDIILLPFSLAEVFTPILSAFVLLFLGRGIYAAFEAMTAIRRQLHLHQCAGRIAIGLTVDVLPQTTEDGAKGPKHMVLAFAFAWVLLYLYEILRLVGVLT